MGLAGRKQKQRIPADPRNLSWAGDASRFGLSYLSKLGWDASQGLGSSGDGMKTHLKVQQKLDMMGIGAQHQRDPNGIAWKQNKEFESLLKRLNEGAGQGDGVDEQSTMFTHAPESSLVTKKRKHRDEDDTEAIEDTKKKKHPNSSSDEAASSAFNSASESPPPLRAPSSPSAPVEKSRPMAHRARIRAAKRIADKSASAISEILGIAPSSSVSSSSTPTTSDPQPSLMLNKLTTSTKSVADYFKEKLLARSSASLSPIISSSPLGFATPGLSNVSPPDDEVDAPRRGIGNRAPPILSFLRSPEESTLNDGDNCTDVLTEKQRRKLERKKRKRREIEDNQVPAESVSTSLKEQTKEDDSKTLRDTFKEKKCPVPTGGPSGNDDTIAKIEREGEPRKESKREHKKKRSKH